MASLDGMIDSVRQCYSSVKGKLRTAGLVALGAATMGSFSCYTQLRVPEPEVYVEPFVGVHFHYVPPYYWDPWELGFYNRYSWSPFWYYDIYPYPFVVYKGQTPHKDFKPRTFDRRSSVVPPRKVPRTKGPTRQRTPRRVQTPRYAPKRVQTPRHAPRRVQTPQHTPKKSGSDSNKQSSKSSTRTVKRK